MIVMKYTGAGIAPFFCCDSCGEPIRDATKGAVIFRFLIDNGETEARHVHKGKCFHQAEAEIGGTTAWEDLARHILQVSHNSGMTIARVNAEARIDEIRRQFI